MPMVTGQGVIENTTSTVDQFFQAHPERLSSSEPIYCLPGGIIRALSLPQSRGTSILDENAARWESDFGALCSSLTAVGLWNRDPISFSLMAAPAAPSVDDLRKIGLTDQQILEIEQLLPRTAQINERLRGYAGWLIVDPTFRNQRDELHADWNALPDVARPARLQRSMQTPVAPADAIETAPELANFQRRLNVFLDHWGLMGMATWDLPEPQGPLIPMLLPPGSPAIPRHGLHIMLPVHFPLTGADAILAEIQRQQAALARRAKLDDAVAGLPHHRQYAQMFNVNLWEMVIRSRYGQRGQRNGLVTAIEHAIAAELDVDVSTIQRIRKDISLCLRGRRDRTSCQRDRSARRKS